MAIIYDGKVIRLQAKPGKEGMAEFQQQVRRAFNLGDDVELDCVFDCRAPGTGEKVKLRGMQSYSAAMHCAAVAAGERLAKMTTAGPPAASDAAPPPRSSPPACNPSPNADAGQASASASMASTASPSADSGSPAGGSTLACRGTNGPSAASQEEALLTTGSGSRDRTTSDSLGRPGRCNSSAQLLPSRGSSDKALRPSGSDYTTSNLAHPTGRWGTGHASTDSGYTAAPGSPGAAQSASRVPSTMALPPISPSHQHVPCPARDNNGRQAVVRQDCDGDAFQVRYADHVVRHADQRQQQQQQRSPRDTAGKCALPCLASPRRDGNGPLSCTGAGAGVGSRDIRSRRSTSTGSTGSSASSGSSCAADDCSGLGAGVGSRLNLLAGFFKSLTAARRIM